MEIEVFGHGYLGDPIKDPFSVVAWPAVDVQSVSDEVRRERDLQGWRMGGMSYPHAS